MINDWLLEMPERGELYDESLHGQSAEEIYDTILKEFRKYAKLSTFRGYGKGDILGKNANMMEQRLWTIFFVV